MNDDVVTSMKLKNELQQENDVSEVAVEFGEECFQIASTKLGIKSHEYCVYNAAETALTTPCVIPGGLNVNVEVECEFDAKSMVVGNNACIEQEE